jgi:hypothetical protein
VRVADSSWRIEHWRQISEAYKKAPYFSVYGPVLKDMYLNEAETNLSSINFNFIKAINSILKIDTPIRWSMEFSSPAGKTERLVDICKKLEADEYLSGTAAKDYLDETLFAREKISVRWTDYSDFPVYQQLNPPFEHGVSVVDLVLNEGPNAYQYLKDKIWI